MTKTNEEIWGWGHKMTRKIIVQGAESRLETPKIVKDDAHRFRLPVILASPLKMYPCIKDTWGVCRNSV